MLAELSVLTILAPQCIDEVFKGPPAEADENDPLAIKCKAGQRPCPTCVTHQIPLFC